MQAIPSTPTSHVFIGDDIVPGPPEGRSDDADHSMVCCEGSLIDRHESRTDREERSLSARSPGLPCGRGSREWAASQLRKALAASADESTLAINPIIYAEVSIRFERIEDLKTTLPPSEIRRFPLPWAGDDLS